MIQHIYIIQSYFQEILELIWLQNPSDFINCTYITWLRDYFNLKKKKNTWLREVKKENKKREPTYHLLQIESTYSNWIKSPLNIKERIVPKSICIEEHFGSIYRSNLWFVWCQQPPTSKIEARECLSPRLTRIISKSKTFMKSVN